MSRTRANAEKPRVSKAAPYPFPDRRKRKCKGRDKILAWHRLLCNGERHAIGLTVKGRLVFSNHDMKELNSAITLVKFGEVRCTCAMALYHWRLGRESMIPEWVARERPVWHAYSKNSAHDVEEKFRPGDPQRVLAFRLMQRRRRKRDVDAYQGKRLMSDQEMAGWSTRAERVRQLAERVSAELYETLVGFGWRRPQDKIGFKPRKVTLADGSTRTQRLCSIHRSGLDVHLTLPDPSDDDAWKHWMGHAISDYSERRSLVNVDYTSGLNDFVQVGVLGSHDVSVTFTNQHEWDKRWLADMAEYELLYRLLDRQDTAQQVLQYRDLARSVLRSRRDVKKRLAGWQDEDGEETISNASGRPRDNKQPVPTAFRVAVDKEDQATCSMSMKLTGLTPQAAVLLARATESCMKVALERVLRASRARRKGAVRVPAPITPNLIGEPARDPRERV